MIPLEDEFNGKDLPADNQLVITSSAFAGDGFIPARHTCDAENISPPLSVAGLPAATKSVAVIVDDPDAPVRPWVHWVIWNIPPVQEIEENYASGTQGINDFRKHHYFGPCPPGGTHRYYFKVYALDTVLNISGKLTDKTALENAIKGHVIASGQLMGKYHRQRGL